ncbi:ADP-ribose pyrophosphatase [hydrothermal vent metagenome]|uniref:ADP-ribose pyrophosphatase n=1 Tax=hydrothermal vent metagenome TaxID=652676 RepID=A0A3B0XCC0_9ZZZZ
MSERGEDKNKSGDVPPRKTPRKTTHKKPCKNPWTTLNTQSVYENAWIEVEHHQVLTPGGSEGIYGKVRFKNRAVGIIPVDKAGNTWLVGQFRYTLDEWCWEIPMGGAPHSESCLDCARRELEEETGLIGGKIIELLRLHPSNSITDEQGFVYLATELHPGVQRLDDTEQGMQIKKIPLNEAVKMAQEGEITDAMSVAGLFFLAMNPQLI